MENEAVLTRNKEKSLREVKEECLKDSEDWESFNSRELEERETMMLDFHEVELNEEIEKEKETKSN